VNLFNAQGQLVDTDYSYTRLDILPAGDYSCFHVWFLSSPSYSYYEFETTYAAASSPSLPIAVLNHSGSYNATFDDWYEIVGQARHDSSLNAEFVNITDTLYGPDDKVIGCDNTYTNADVLTPRQTSTWKQTFVNVHPGSVS